jgi:hypothetical protein
MGAAPAGPSRASICRADTMFGRKFQRLLARAADFDEFLDAQGKHRRTGSAD